MKIRYKSTVAICNRFCIETHKWKFKRPKNSLSTYISKFGIFHLLEQDKKKESEARLLDLDFLTEFIGAWPTAIKPLAVLRIIGLKKMEVQFINEFGNKSLFVTDRSRLHTLCSFLSNAGLLKSAQKLSESLYEIIKQAFGEEHPDALMSLQDLSSLYYELGLFTKSASLLRGVLSSHERIYGKENPRRFFVAVTFYLKILV